MFLDRPVGIDLGTTNSEIALLRPSERDIVIYADRFGRKTIPSAVAWDSKSEQFLVGHPARARRGRTPHPIESIKRKMGQAVRIEVGSGSLSPEEISAKILIELRDRMREHLASQAAEGVELRVVRAVITVPAYFDAPQIEATRRAGELAGLEVIGLLQEPTAAAIYHTWKNRLKDGNFLIYDLGGGTFDVSILRCLGGEYQVLAIDGDNYLGGDDLDRRFAEWLRLDLVKRGYALDLDVRGDDEDRHRFERLVHLAQEIKESLSTTPVVHVSKQDVLRDRAGEVVSYEAEIGLADYEKAIGDLVETTIACCERAVARSREIASVGLEEIDHVVLVGGSTRVPLVMRRVTEALCAKSRAKEPLQDDVDTCVALGAAVHAAQIGGLVVGDDAKNVKVHFTAPLVGQGAKLRLALRVLAAPEGTKELVLRDHERELGKASIAAVPSEPLKLEVALGEPEENPVTLAFVGDHTTEVTMAVYRGDVRPRASALSRASVVAKDIAIEVVRGGKRERRILLARGAGLPASTEHQFFTVDQSGAVVLRLLQNRLPIKTLLLEVSKDLPIGTRVDLTLRCDETMRMEARAIVAGQELWAQIEPPPMLARFDPRGSVEAILEEAEQASRGLWGSYGTAFRREADALLVSIREVASTDPDKLEALCQRLRLLLDEYRGGPSEGLVPPMHSFEEALDSLRRVVYRAGGSLVGMDRPEWDARIQAIDERARRAFDQNDGATWRRAFNEVQALYETAHQEEFASLRLDDPAYVTRRVHNITAWATRLGLSLADYVPAAAEDVRALQLEEQARISSWLQDKATTPLAALGTTAESTDATALRRKLDQIATELERIESALERIPSIGLVTDRGA
jgi:molecular chaperone DnaK